MSSPENHHLQGRILATFALLALTMLALGVLNIYSAQRMERDARNFTDKVIPKLVLAGQITGKIGLVEAEVFHHVVALPSDHMREIEARMALLVDQNTKIYGQLGALMEGEAERRRYAEVLELRRENQTVRGELIGLSRLNKDDARLTPTLHRHFDAYQLYQGAVVGLTRQMQTEAAMRWVVSVRAINRFRIAGYLLLGVGLAVGLAMTVVLARVARTLAESNRLFAIEIAERRRAEAAVVGAIEGEQRRIARDLHDGLVQHLAGVFFLNETLSSKLRTAAPEEAAQAGRISELLGQAVTQARGLARGLNPVGLEARGLVPALEDLAASLRQTWGVPCTVEWDGFAAAEGEPPATGLEAEAETHLFRIAQEAMNNAIRHGSPGRIRLRLERSRRALTLSIADDGSGLLNPLAEGKGMGLRSMQYRARMIGGTLEISPAPGGGTIVSCKIAYR